MKMTRLRKEKREKWLTVDKNTVENLKNSDALALWIRLMGLPDGWILRDSWLKSELALGDVRLAKAKKYLISLGLWEVITLRDPSNGHLAGREILIKEEIPNLTQDVNFNPSPPPPPSATSTLEIFGLQLPSNLQNIISEKEIIRVAMLKKLDAQQLQRLLGQFSAMASSSKIRNPKNAFWSLAERQSNGDLGHTQKGDERLPKFE